MIKNKFFPLLLVLFVSFQASSQQAGESIDSLTGQFVKTIQSDNKEKIILQTDRKVYAAGEKIWFNAFLLRQLTNKLDTSSKNLFVDLVNDKDSVITRVVLNTGNFPLNGALSISDSLANGYYWLRSYTKKILRDNFNGLYIQPLYVMNINTHDPSVRASYTPRFAKTPVTSNKPALNFFPEGGAIVTGINSTVALQLTDAKGNPMTISGYIASEQDSIVANFTTNRMGLARVSFYPVWFHKYKAVIRQNNQDIAYPLPSYNPFLAQLAVTEQNDAWINTTVALEDSIYKRKFRTTILGISGGRVCYAASGNGNYQANIPVNNFPGGIATLLLYDADQHLLSERKVFIKKENYTLNLQTNKQNYAARDSVRISLAITDNNGKPLVGALNVSVQDERIQQMSDVLETDTIKPVTLTLNDWLKKNMNRYADADIDLMMLTQPPEFKNWKVDSLAMLSEGNEETQLFRYVSGRVIDRKNRPLKDMVVTEISKKNDDNFFDVDTTDASGAFRLDIPQNRDSLLLNVKVTDKRGNHFDEDNIIFDTFNFPHFATPVPLKESFFTGPVNIPQWLRIYHIDTVFKGVGKGWLAPVTVKGRKKREANYNVSKRVDPFSYVITADKLKNSGYQGVGNALLGLPGIRMKEGYVIFLGGNGQEATAKTEPIVILDGAQVTVGEGSSVDPDPSPVLKFLNTLNPEDIEFMEVLTGGNAAMYGVRGANGVILINTKSRLSYMKDIDNGFKMISPVTYHIAPSFNEPNYADKSVRNNKLPDYRNTIYWDGNVITDVKGKTSVDFFTADAATTYTVTITGITQNGDYIYKKLLINRK